MSTGQITGPAMIVEQPGPATLIEDLGRPGFAALGVTESGAFDRAALRLANRLVGNPADAAAVEALGGGLTVRFSAPVVVAVTGAAGPLRVADRSADRGAWLRIPTGALLRLGGPVAGLRSYLAVRGGLRAQTLLGSASADPTGGLGPAPLRAGEVITLGAPTGAHPARAGVELAPAAGPRVGEVVLRGRWGPRADWLTAAARETLGRARWRVSADSDRVGVRLTGPLLQRAITAELPSEGVVRGGVQVPPSGQPVIFGPDHPTTGGYPVAAVLSDADTDLLAQLAPGATVRFRLRAGRPLVHPG